MVDKKQSGKLSRSRAGSLRSSLRSRAGKVTKTAPPPPPPLPPRAEGGAPPSSPVKSGARLDKLQPMLTPRRKTLPLSYPSPPLLTNPHSAPLTSTFLVSPPKMMMYSKVRKEKILTTSPASPELSGIGRRVSVKDVTTYQNYEAGVAYVPAAPYCRQDTNLSRFNVSPPRPAVSGTGENNNRGEHAGIGWIYGTQSRAQKKLSLPKKKIRYLDAASVGLSPDMRMVLKMNHILNSNKKEMRTMRRQTAGRTDGDYCDMKPSLTLQNTEFSLAGEDLASLISFDSLPSSSGGSGEHRQLPQSGTDPRVSALIDSGLSDQDILATLLQWSGQPASSGRLRGGCLPYLVSLLHQQGGRARAGREIRCQALHVISNLINNQTHSDKRRKRESKVIGLLWLTRQYTDFIRDVTRDGDMMARTAVGELGCSPVRLMAVKCSGIIKCELVSKETLDIPQHNFLDFGGKLMNINIVETVGLLTRCSFDEKYRDPIISLGGVQSLAELLLNENQLHHWEAEEMPGWRELRRFIVISLTNLTFGNSTIKSYLCTAPGFIPALVDLLESHSDHLHKAASHLLRNLAWKADKPSKVSLSRCGVVSVLVSTAMRISAQHLKLTARGRTVEPGAREQTIKVVLSALWNLSAHCKRNKVEVCEEPGSLVFLVELLRSSSMTIVENGGGILRNISSYIAMSDRGELYRAVLREENCLSLLLEQLRSSSLTIVSNSAGTLWNLSARSVTDQSTLIEMGAIPILQSLTNSKHKSIATCATAAIKNLQSSRLISSSSQMYGGSLGLGLLTERKARSLAESLQSKLAESVEDSGGDDISDDESYDEDSLLSSGNVTEVKVDNLPDNMTENNLPAHTNGNYLSRKLENINLLHQTELPLDLSKKPPVLSGTESHCVEVSGQGDSLKLDTRPDTDTASEEKASFETKGEKDGGSLCSMDTDTTQSWCEEGSPVSAKSHKDDSESDLDNDMSESLLHDLISSAMPQADRTEQSVPLPTPRSVWDCEDSPDLTVISQPDSDSVETARHDTTGCDNDGVMSYNVEDSPFNLSENTARVNESLENVLNTTLQNINNINNNNTRPATKKEATFVLDRQSPGDVPCVQMRKSQSEHQLGRDKEENKKDNRRSWSKSPRSSRLIPGVVIKELKLKPRTPEKNVWPVKSEDNKTDTDLVTAKVEQQEEQTNVNLGEIPGLKMTASVISNYDDTISQIEEPSAMGNINDCVSLSSHPLEEGLDNILRDCDLSKASISQKLESICPPTLMNEITANSQTLVADKKPNVVGATFTVEDESNTVDDVTDVFDEESTLTPREADDDLCEIPELPLDSQHTTPTHTTSSRTTPDTVRRIMEERNILDQEKDEDTTSRLTYIVGGVEESETSGYRSLSTDIVDVDERLRELVADLKQWAEEDDKMSEIECEANMMAESLASAVSGEEGSRCSSVGILRESHITKLALNSDLLTARPQSSINTRDSFANKEIRPKIAPKPLKLNFVQNKFQSAERNKSYLIATNNPQLAPETVKISNTDKNLQLEGNKISTMEKPKDKKSLKFSKLWKRTDDSKPSKPKLARASAEPSKSSALSKTFKNFSMKKCSSDGLVSARSPVSDRERLGSSIVLLSPNDTEMRGKLEAAGPGRSDKHRPRPATVLSTRDSLVPIINNPRNKFLQTDRALASKRIEFKEAVANNKISASNKITLV